MQLNTKASNSFPLVGETVTLQALTKWAQRIEFIKKQSLEGSPINETINNTSQATETTITVTTEGELQQKVRAMNFDNDGITGLFSAEKSAICTLCNRNSYRISMSKYPKSCAWVISVLSPSNLITAIPLPVNIPLHEDLP